ncbi:HEPN domain-containing protein [Pelagerythrobacter aerophilus]
MAREAAENRIKILEKTVRQAGIKKLGVPTNLQKAVFYNCVFQLCAVLEDYLSGLIKQWYSRLHINDRDISRYPDETIKFLMLRKLEAKFKNYLLNSDEVNAIRRLNAEYGYLRNLFTSRPQDAQYVGSSIVSGKKFPSPDNLKILFYRIGKPDLHGKMSARLGQDFEIALQAFLDVRNAIAHEFPPDITQVDAIRYVNEIRRWIHALDRELCSHICKTSELADWPA